MNDHDFQTMKGNIFAISATIRVLIAAHPQSTELKKAIDSVAKEVIATAAKFEGQDAVTAGMKDTFEQFI